MPTSSQAMILRGMSISGEGDISFRCFRPDWRGYKGAMSVDKPRVINKSNAPNKDLRKNQVCRGKNHHYQQFVQSHQPYDINCPKCVGGSFTGQTESCPAQSDKTRPNGVRHDRVTPTSISECSFGSLEKAKMERNQLRTDCESRPFKIKCIESPAKATVTKCKSELLNDATFTYRCKKLGKDPPRMASPTQFSYADKVRSQEAVVKSCKPQSVVRKSLLDEVKECVNWDKRVNPSTFARNNAARFMPTTACFSLRDGQKFSHKDIKCLVEDQIRCQVAALQYDPVAVRMGEQRGLDRWLVTFRSRRERDRAVNMGLELGQDKVIVQAWDDLVINECALTNIALATTPTGDSRLSKRRNIEAKRQYLALKQFLAVN